MKKLIYIGMGGFCGAILRVLVKGIQIANYHENVPINTLFVNIAGCFLLGLILTVALEITRFRSSLRLGIATGFLGAFTTFSTLCREIAGLIYQGYYFSALSYMAISTMLGLAATYFGIVVAREAVIGRIRDRRNRLCLKSLKSDESEAE